MVVVPGSTALARSVRQVTVEDTTIMAANRPDPKKIKEAQETVKKFLDQLKQSTSSATKSIDQDIRTEAQITQIGQAVIKRGITIKDDDE